MRNSLRRSAVVGSIVGAVVGILAPAAYADTWYSAWKDFTSNGVNYQNRAGAIRSDDLDPTEFVGSTVRRVTGDAPINRMGARARAYFQSDALCAAGTWVYNDVATHAWTVWYVHPCRAFIYSRGQTRTWIPSGYDTLQTYKTVVFNSY